jgi:hypothetical protein
MMIAGGGWMRRCAYKDTARRLRGRAVDVGVGFLRFPLFFEDLLFFQDQGHFDQVLADEP